MKVVDIAKVTYIQIIRYYLLHLGKSKIILE